MRRLSLISLAFVVISMAFGAQAASAAQRFIPSGIDARNPVKAKSQVLDLASVNDDYAATLAKQTGATSFNRKDYKQVGYSKAPSDTINSADAGGGSVGGTTGGVGVKTLVLVNVKTRIKIHIMVRCANPRLKKGTVRPKLMRVSKGTKVNFKKRWSKQIKYTCPSGQPVVVTVKGVATGSVEAKVWIKAYGEIRASIDLQMQLKIKQTITIKCGAVVTPPGPGISQNQEAKNDCTAGKIWDHSQQMCVIIQVQVVCGVVVVGGGTVNTGDICPQNPPPVIPPPPVTPEDSLPVARVTTPAHLFVEGTGFVYFEGGDADGTSVSATIEVTAGLSSAYIAGVIPVPFRWDGTACPAYTVCYRATLWALTTPGLVTMKVTATSGGKSATVTGNTDIKAETPGSPGGFDMQTTDSAHPGEVVKVDSYDPAKVL